MLNTTSLMQRLEHWAEAGALRSLDLAFTRFIAQQNPNSDEAVLLAAALVSERNGHGHVCLDLASTLTNPKQLLHSLTASPEELAAKEELNQYLSQYDVARWQQALAQHPAVANAEQGPHNTPFVLAGSAEQPLLYLRRYWQYEQHIMAAIQERLANPPRIEEEAAKTLLNDLFPASEQRPDWQKIACLLAAKNRFAIITGGPGTGKTTTVVRLLALLQGLNLHQGLPALRIHLAAPTGKAAARLSESIAKSVSDLNTHQEIKDQVPTTASTLHRLLGTQPNSRHFRHHVANPLPTDCVVVDEASMMDVEMMAQLVDALPPQARLILLGDKDQLASVEAGSVLGDLCHTAEQGHYTPATQQTVQALSGETISAEHVNAEGPAIAQATSMLRHSYRFDKHPGIGALATLVNTGRATHTDVHTTIAAYPSILSSLKLNRAQALTPLQQLAVQGYSGYLRVLREQRPQHVDTEQLNQWALKVFAAHNKFQLLTAVRRGPFGVENINQTVMEGLQRKGWLHADNKAWYHGRPVLVTQNNYSLRLMNGDIGICMAWPDNTLRVAFPDGQGSIRWLLPSRLVGVETVFAMTVHKSQGSEFTHTAFVLPETINPVLTKELLYTAITRSKEQFTLVYSDEGVLKETLQQRVNRSSGLLR